MLTHNVRKNRRKGPLRDAKRQNDIPYRTQPDRVVLPGTKEGNAIGLRNGENLRLYEYTNRKGQNIWIREDAPVTYADGGSQPWHFNSGSAGLGANGKQNLPLHHYK